MEKAAANANIELSPDPWPEQALFTRSDHYAFVKQGVPSVFMVPGLKSKDPNVDGSKVFGQFFNYFQFVFTVQIDNYRFFF